VSVQDWQIVLPTGVTVGAGTSVNIVEITGLRDMAPLRSGDVARAQADGSYSGLNLLGERAVTIKWDITLAPSIETAIQTLSAGWQNVPDPAAVTMTSGDWLRQQAGVGTAKPVSMLQIKLPGRAAPLYLFGRPTKFSLPINTDYQFGKVQIVTEWVSADGVLYDGSVVTGQSGLPSPTSGLSWPASFPWTFGHSTGGSIALNNTGSYAAMPLIVLYGPMSYPTITNQNTGEFMKLSIVMGVTDTVVSR
jgi:hypothetical protein